MQGQTEKAGVLMLTVAALIWGFGFVTQRIGGDAFGAFTYNCIRFLLGGIALIPLALLRWKKRGPQTASPLGGGIVCGVALFFASNLQQVGITMGTTVAKAGFLTACYILLVPILLFVLYRTKVAFHIWIAILITLVGLYLLTIGAGGMDLKPQTGDLLVMGCAFCFAVQIIIIDRFAPETDGICFSCVEFLTCGLCSAVPALVNDLWPDPRAWAAPFFQMAPMMAFLYGGLLATAGSYTLQVVGQKRVAPTIASLLMSLESVFATFFGWVFLGEHLSLREAVGCALIFAAVLLAQKPER